MPDSDLRGGCFYLSLTPMTDPYVMITLPGIVVAGSLDGRLFTYVLAKVLPICSRFM